MIKLQDLTPNVYYEKSRDFQFIGRLYDIVLNYVKTNADTLYNLPSGKNMNERLLNLLSLTLGFQAKHNYNAVQLRAICSVLPYILRNKGSLNAALIATNALLHAEGIRQPLDYSIDSKKSIVLYLPEQLSDLSLLKDLLTYILPAGIGCSMVKEVSERTKITTDISTWDEINVYINSQKTSPAILGKIAHLGDSALIDELGYDPIANAMSQINPNAKPNVAVNATILNETDLQSLNQNRAENLDPSADITASENPNAEDTPEEP